LLFRDDFNRPDGAVGSDWVAESGTWQIVNNALQTSVAQSQTAVLRLGALANRQDYHVQLRSSRSQLINYAPMMVRRAYNMMYQLDLGSTNEAGGVPRLYRLNGWWNLLKYGTFKSVADSSYRITFSAIGSSLRVWINGGREITAEDGLGGNLVPGNFALQAYAGSVPGTMRFDDVVICSGRTITVTGVPVGYRVRVVGSVSPPAGSGGTVTLDLFGTQLPAAQVEILDNTDAVVKVFAPTDGVWGGDRYSLNGAP
jgi:hypothetical protein